jgi:hypothetical protein
MRLFVSPITVEILEAVFRTKYDVHLTCSVGHVGPKNYTGFSYDAFRKMYDALAYVYGKCPLIERDHLGKVEDVATMMQYVEDDIAAGFDACMLHTHSFDRIEPILSKFGKRLQWQIGPGEDDSKEIEPGFWEKVIPWATWLSAPVGTRIVGLTNEYNFHPSRIPHEWMLEDSIAPRAHNCDYLTMQQLKEVSICFPSINIAPQLGVLQSCLYLYLARSNGLPIKAWEEACRNDTAHQARWGVDEFHAVQAIGHYHFDKIEWKPEASRYVTGVLTQYLEDVCNAASN